MFSVLNEIIIESVNLWMAMSPYLLLGMFIAGILHVFLGEDFISNHLGGNAFSSIAKATLFGIPLPICSCGVIPVAASLDNDGASKSATLSFLVSTPTTGVDSIMATYSLMGPLFAIFRPIAAFLGGIIIGVLNYFFNPEKNEKKVHKKRKYTQPKHLKIIEAFKYGFIELAEDIGKWLLIGVVIGGILSVVIPTDLFLNRFSSPLFHFVIMLVLAIPLYVCATGSIPIAATLIQKGFSPGSALIFLIAGPATNAVTLAFVRSKLGKRAFYIYLITIVFVALSVGWVFNIMWMKLGQNLSLISPHGGHLPLSLRVGSAVILFLLIVKGFIKTKEKKATMKYELYVPDMTCKRCKEKIEGILQNTNGVTEVNINLDSKTVNLNGDVDITNIKTIIQEAGYSPEIRR